MADAYLSATDALAAFRTGEVSPLELFDAIVEAAGRTEPVVNAFTFTDFDASRERAAHATELYAQDPATVRPLEGIVVAVKELIAVRSQQHTLGSRALRGNVATVTEPAVQRVLDAGAIVHARTNTPEFGCASVTDSPLFGETLNPWNTAFGPAGSSGGSAAALAAGSTTLAQGTDSAGSLRLPAAACGVVGFKPSRGRVPRLPPMNLEPCEHLGPMARTVADCALLFSVMAGPHRCDLGSYLPAADPAGPRTADGARVGLAHIDGLDVDLDVAAGLTTSVDALRNRGALIADVDLGWTYERIITATKLVYAGAYGPSVGAVASADPQLMSDYALDFVADVMPLAESPDFTLRARRMVGELQEALATAFESFDFLLLPTLAFPAPLAGDHYVDHGPVVNGTEQADRWMVGHTVPFNLMSSCPVLSVPSGVARNGIPVGMQIVGRPYGDSAVLALGAEFEAERDLGLYRQLRPTVDASSGSS